MYLISIYFDESTEKKLKSYMKKVAKVTGNTFMLDNHVPPHITVAAVETKQEDELVANVEKLVEQLQSDVIQLVSIGSFSSKVIYVQPVLNEYLHTMSIEIAKALGQMEETILSPYYQPFSWLAHCTIGKQLTKEQLKEAFMVLTNEFVPMEAKVTRIGVAKTNPHRDIKVWEL